MRPLLRALRGTGSRPQPASPPVPAADADALDRAPGDDEFITGNGIAARCGWARNHGEPRVQPDGRDGWFFCKTDFVDWFFAHEAPRRDFVLFTHNSDIPIDGRFARHLRNRRLRAWFAANAVLDHPKLRPLPLGIANPHWPHGDVDALRQVRDAPPPRERLFDVSFSVDTNPEERRRCVELTGLRPEPPLPFRAYLERLASSWFSLCPRGNGIDTHRTWEALYLGTVPVVTRSRFTDAHPELPLVVLDDWAEFASVEFSPELHARLRSGWDPQSLRLDRYLERLPYDRAP